MILSVGCSPSRCPRPNQVLPVTTIILPDLPNTMTIADHWHGIPTNDTSLTFLTKIASGRHLDWSARARAAAEVLPA
eukprot:1427172-Rhodomonas_salina.3